MNGVSRQRGINVMGEIIGFGDVMYAQTAANTNTANAQTGAITITLGNAATGETTSQNAELWGSPGLISVPLGLTTASDPTQAATGTVNNVGTQALYANFNDQKVIIAVRDLRTMLQAGQIKAGETCLYAPGGQGTINLKNDNSITISSMDSNISVLPASKTISLTASSNNSITIADSSISLGNNSTQYIMINPTALNTFLTSLVSAIATITSDTTGATAMANVPTAQATMINAITSTLVSSL